LSRAVGNQGLHANRRLLLGCEQWVLYEVLGQGRQGDLAIFAFSGEGCAFDAVFPRTLIFCRGLLRAVDWLGDFDLRASYC
jgi:hypothetical protein